MRSHPSASRLPRRMIVEGVMRIAADGRQTLIRQTGIADRALARLAAKPAAQLPVVKLMPELTAGVQ